jgi:acyl-CoA thioester hydrolase
MILPDLADKLRLLTTARYRVPVAVRYQDLDANGHVNHGLFPALIEEARLAMRRELVGAGDGERGWVIAGLAIQYLAPLHYPVTVDIGVSLVHVGRASFRLGYGLFAGDTCAAIAETRSVYVDRSTGKSASLPGEFAARLEALIGPPL